MMTRKSKKLPHCQYCGEPVKLAWTHQGMAQDEEVSFDASPDPEGDHMMHKRPVEGGGHRTYALWVDMQEAAAMRAQGALLWKRHEKTCPKWPDSTKPRVDPDWLAAKVAQLNLPGGPRG